MFLTEAEILDTPLSLNYTCQYFEMCIRDRLVSPITFLICSTY